MKRKLEWFGVFGACAALCLLVGCGASPAGGTATSGAPLNLAGNWWITQGAAGSNPTPSVTGMALTLTVSGEAVTGGVSIYDTCGSTQFLYVNPVSGTIGSDGSFTLTNTQGSTLSTTNPIVLSLHGQTPTTAGGVWNGSYSYTALAGTCATVSVSAPSTVASSMPLLGGTFAETGNFQQSGVLTPVTIKMALQQGGTTSGTLPYEDDLTGTISVTGSSCLTSGAIPSTGGGIIEGTDVQLQFTMNDGSVLFFLGDISATDTSQFTGTLLTTGTGSCNNGIKFIPPSTYLGVYTKQ